MSTASVTGNVGVTAFVLIGAVPGSALEVAQGLSRFREEGVKEVYLVSGPYDILARIEVASNKALLELVNRIAMPTSPQKVKSTRTMIASDNIWKG